MKKVAIIIAFVVAALSLGGCDFFRRLAGRPVSAEIEAKRAAMELAGKEKQALQDTVAPVPEVADSSLVGTRDLKEDSGKKLEYRYYVVVGTFNRRENAERFSQRIKAKGYPVSLIDYVNGITAVGVCPSNTMSGAFSALRNLLGESFCPGDAWILDTHGNL